MTPSCKKCDSEVAIRSKIIRKGFYYRTSDSKFVQRFYCHMCKGYLSHATSNECFGQKKRHKNEMLRRLLCSGVSQRRAARILCLSRQTVVRKFLFLSDVSRRQWLEANEKKPKASIVEFDDLETIEHTKYKPLSITLAVEGDSGRLLGFEVSKMPAKGRLARVSRDKYGVRKDERGFGRRKLLMELAPLVTSRVTIKSDSNPHYPSDVAKFFPRSIHMRVLGKRGAVTGQGELKKVGFDPLFSLNHACAMLRADINRLFRRTWCTTKIAARLEAHLFIYANYYNQQLKLRRRTPIPSLGAG